MEGIAQVYISQLRNKDASVAEFRAAAQGLSRLLAFEIAKKLSYDEVPVQTPLAQTKGQKLARQIVLIPILRSGLAMLPPFLEVFPSAHIGFVGMVRDEKTAIPSMYYKRLPIIGPDDQIVVIDPMLATGGSLSGTLEILVKEGIAPERMCYAGIIAAPEGVHAINAQFPQIPRVIAVVDEELNAEKFILPGIGDFGDRYFVTP